MHRLIPVALATLIATANAACTPAQMAVPRPLQQGASALKVNLDRGPVNEHVSFGKWHTTEVDRSWTTRIGAGVKFGGVGMAHETADQPYTFTLENKVEVWKVECVTRFRNEATTVGPLKIREGTTRIRCVGFDSKNKRRVEVASMMVGSGRVGVVHLGESWLALNTEHRLSTGQQIGTAAGYTMRAGNAMLAAVQTINDRKVWLKNGLKPETEGPVAVTLASVLLYREIKASSQRIF
jgi:hypothetical protein